MIRRKGLYSLFLVIPLLVFFIYKIAYSLDYPHSDANAISCRSCHATHGPLPGEWATHTPVNADDSPLNNICWSCHNDLIAPYEKTHSSLSTSSGYGNWTFECRVCHNPHKQSQTKAYGIETYLYSGASTSVTADAVTKTSVITKAGAGWTPDQNEWAEMLVIPDIYTASPVYFKIVSNTSESLTVEGVIDLTAVHAGDTFAIVYGKLVKENINSRPVKFFRDSGTNSFADGNTSYDGICEVCHTKTGHFRNDGTSQPHSDGQSKAGVRCTDCHLHREGFKGSCNACHGNPPVDGSTLVHTAPTGSTTAGAHDLHANTQGYKCQTCHCDSAGSGQTHNNQKVTVGFSLFEGAYLNGDYDGQSQVNYDGTCGTLVSRTGTKECSNIYCHGSTMAPNGGTDITPVWDDPSTAQCGKCHGATAANPPIRGSHQTHAGATGRSLECTACHYGYEPLHVNNEANFAFDTTTYPWMSGSSYSGDKTMLNAYGNCSNLYCHSNVQSGNGTSGPTVYASPTWGNAATGACGTCHEGDTGAKMSTGSHTKHTADSPAGANISCSACHFGAGSGTVKHADHRIDISFDSFNPSGVYSQAVDNPPGNGYGTCTNLYCHSDGTAVAAGALTGAATAVWNTSTTCSSCHGYPPDYPNGFPKANSHLAHGGRTCDMCHYATTADGATISGVSNHANKMYDLQGNGVSFTYTYNSHGGTCSNISCHGNVTAQWGATLGCSGCHGNPPNTGAHLAHTNGTGSAYGSDANNSIQSAHSFNCGNCHPIDASKHMNGTVEVELYSPDAVGFKARNLTTAWRTGTGASTVCSDIYCHSDGRDSSVRTYKASPQWGGTFTGNKCAGCHDDPPSYENTGPGSAGANSHQNHLVVGIHMNGIAAPLMGKVAATGGPGTAAAHGEPATSTTISCNICHAATVDWTDRTQFSTKSGAGTASGCDACHDGSTAFANSSAVITNKANHVNGVSDLVFPSRTINVKAQLGRSTFEYWYVPAGWARNTFKETMDSHDSVNLSYTGTYSTEKKSCTVACHWEPVPWGTTDLTCASCHVELKGGHFN